MKELPRGAFIFARGLDHDVTEEDVHEFLSELGFNIPLENISVKQNSSNSCALVSVTKEIASDTFNWIVGEKRLRGMAVQFAPFSPVTNSNLRNH